jgi:CubicO group peptidase (beta-lactamase class C family)
MTRLDLAAATFSVSLIVTGALALLGQDAAAPRSLEGVWGAKRNFGPEIAGTLEVFQVNGEFRASIAQYNVKCVHEKGHISFDLPSDQGSFTGRLQENGAAIRGFWIQPPTVNAGAQFASPVVLRSNSKGRWQGEVVPLKDEFTLYLVVKRRADGSMGAFIRNPDRNIGVFWKVDRLEQDGNQIRLVGESSGEQRGKVYAEGLYHPDDNRISLYTNRGGTYDFTPVSDDSSFYARGRNPPAYEYRRPITEDDGWSVATLEEVGMERGPIAEFVHAIDSVPAQSVHDPYVHAFLVARHGKLVAEEYFYGFSRFHPHDTRSAAKSVTATLFGAVMQSGVNVSPSTRVYDLLYHGNLPNEMDPRKKEMTVEHLLTMSSGYDCDDSNGSRPGSEDVLLDDQPDPNYYRYTLQLPFEPGLKPGQEAVYCSINPNLVGDVMATAANKSLFDLFSDLLAEPLQLRDYHLYVQPTGEPYMGGGINWLPRDFMKFGQLMLNGGTWNGKRILSKEYVDRASSPLVTIRGTTKKYGYLWWVADFPYRGRNVRSYYADGNGGNYVLVFPELDMVVAFNAGNYADHAVRVILNEYVSKFILPALKDESR